MIERMVREQIEKWIRDNRDIFNEIIESSVADYIVTLDIYDILLEVATDHSDDIVDGIDIEDIAREIIFENI